MPMCKCINVQTYEWQEPNGTPRKAFRCEWEEMNPNPLDKVLGLLRNRFITLFARDAEGDEAFQQLVDKNSIPNCMVMSFVQEVKPYCRAYTQATKTHQAGELIIDEITSKPRLYTSITVHCRSILDKDGKEVPMNMSEVIRLANNQRKYFIENDDANGVRRYWEPEDVMDIDSSTNIEEDDVQDVPAEVFAPTTPQQKPEQQAATPTQPARPVMPRR